MDPVLFDETASRLGQLRDEERDLAALHGYALAPGVGPYSLDHIDPASGDRITLGAVVARIRQAMREERRRRAQREAHQQHEPVERSSHVDVHASTVAPSVPAVESAK